MTAERIALRVPRDTCFLSQVRGAVVDLARRADFSPERVAEIEIAVDEACSNAVRHARPPAERRADTISVEAVAEDDALTVTIADGGEPFAFDRCGAGDLETWHAGRQTGGLGVYIIRRFMDEVEYRHRPESGGELCMRKYRAAAALAVGGARR